MRVPLSQLNEEAAEQALALEQHFVGKKRPVFARRNQVIKGLVKFWQICLSQHPALKDALTSHDYAILGYCTEVSASCHAHWCSYAPLKASCRSKRPEGRVRGKSQNMFGL